MRTTTASVLTAVAALGLALPPASPATAADPSTITVSDPADVDHGIDLRSVKVQNTATFVRVVLEHTDLVDDPDAAPGGAVYLDTDPDDAGPELAFVGGYFRGTDYALVHTEGFSPDQWGEHVDGSWRMRLDFDADKVVMRMSRAAVGADDLRVAVRVGARDAGDTVVDWLGKKKSFTAWVPRG